MTMTTQKASLAALILAAGLAAAAAQDAPLEAQIIDAMNKIYGVHPEFRANHARESLRRERLRRRPMRAASARR